MVALLKGSEGSIVDLDWAPDALTSGLIASTCKDEKSITLWRCFANQSESDAKDATTKKRGVF